MTAICVPLFVKSGVDIEEAILEAEEALEGTEGMIELRCDTASAKQMVEAIEAAPLPVIVTVRPTWEGGFSEKTEDQRLALYEEAMEAGADYLDIELVTWEKSKKIREAVEDLAEKNGTGLIVSNHSFEGRPADLEKRLERLKAVKAARVLKIAWKAGSILDGVEALKVMEGWGKGGAKGEEAVGGRRGMVALAMGEEGVISRLLAKRAGAFLTFATAGGKESAPGQPTVAELVERYRWQEQHAGMGVYGVAGWPVGHSLSPHIHNAGFEKAGFDGVFVPLAIKGEYEAFAAAVDGLRGALGVKGMSVTIPHKEHAFQYARERGGEIEGLSKELGVINTMVWKGETLKGLNSDYAGALDALVSAWTGSREDVRGKRVAVIGAGGAARAIVAGLAAHGATVVVYNRTRARADELAKEFDGKGGKVVAADWEKLCDSCCEAYVQCTPLGMYPKTEGNPIDFDPAWGPETVVFDTVYNPLKTRFIKLAERKGAKTVVGLEMFVRQAAIQFKEFTGKEADVGLFREVMMGAMRG